MSDKDKQQDEESSAEESTPAEDAIEEVTEDIAEEVGDEVGEEVATEESAPPQAPEVADTPARKGGNGVAWLALLVSVIALASVGYTISRDWLESDDTSSMDAYAGLERDLEVAKNTTDELATRVAELGTLDDAANAGIDALRQELDERVRLLSPLPARLSALESSVSSLAGISDGARDNWLLAEAEYYMQIANAQLQLANNPQLASLALAMADERVVQLANPALTDVRRAISDELAALAVMQKPDIAGTTLTLASLARVVESLPIRSAAVAEEGPTEEPDDEQGSMNRAWASVKGAMSGLVKVTPPDQAQVTLLTPDAEYFLRNNIALQLQAARLALLRGEQAVFEQTLDDTSALLTQYFDSESAPVAGALQTLQEIRGNVFTTSAPDISGSLDLLRQFQTLRENSQ